MYLSRLPAFPALTFRPPDERDIPWWANGVTGRAIIMGHGMDTAAWRLLRECLDQPARASTAFHPQSNIRSKYNAEIIRIALADAPRFIPCFWLN